LIGQQVDQVRAKNLREVQLRENELHGFFAERPQFAEGADRIGMCVRFGEARQSGELRPLRTQEFEIDGDHR
jgi:hypothetical protein